MTAGIAIGLFLMAIVFLVIGLLCGLISPAVAENAGPTPRIAFAWGLAFGPIGIAAMAFVRARKKPKSVEAPF